MFAHWARMADPSLLRPDPALVPSRRTDVLAPQEASNDTSASEVRGLNMFSIPLCFKTGALISKILSILRVF